MKDKEKSNSENAPAETVTTNASTPTGNQREIRNITQDDERLKKVIM